MSVTIGGGGGTIIVPKPDPATVYINVQIGSLAPLKSGNLTADGSEQTLLEFMGVGRIVGYVDLGNMVGGDVIIIRQYMKVVEGGNYRKYAEESYGAQAEPILYIKPKETDFALKITLQQTAGPFRSFPYNFLREA